MRTAEHKYHIGGNVSHNNCSECRADTERRFVDTSQWTYQHVAEYLAWNMAASIQACSGP